MRTNTATSRSVKRHAEARTMEACLQVTGAETLVSTCFPHLSTQLNVPLLVQDFCYYANAIFVFLLLVQPDNERLFMICFAFSEVAPAADAKLAALAADRFSISQQQTTMAVVFEWLPAHQTRCDSPFWSPSQEPSQPSEILCEPTVPAAHSGITATCPFGCHQ